MFLNSPQAFHAFVTRKGGYQHHGIIYKIEVLGLWRAIHFNDAGTNSKENSMVRDTPIEEFQKGDEIIIVPPQNYAFSAEEVHERAKRLLGLDGWNLFNKNCEHFARWCTTGKAESGQVRTAAVIGGVLTLLALVG